MTLVPNDLTYSRCLCNLGLEACWNDLEPTELVEPDISPKWSRYCCEPPDCDSEGASFEDDQINDTEILYEETDWTNPLVTEPIPSDVQKKLQSSIRQLRTLTGELSRSRIKDDKKGVKRDLVEWLGSQAYKLDKDGQRSISC